VRGLKGIAKQFYVMALSFIMTLSLSALFMGVSRASPTEIYIDPAEVVELPCTNFTISIAISAVNNLNAWNAKLRFDPAVLEVISVDEGPFLSSVGSTSFSSAIGANYVSLGCALLEPTSASGDGILATITFHIIARGRCDLHLYETSLLDTDLNPIEHTTSDGLFYNIYPGDVNKDGKVDYKDLFALAAAYGARYGDDRYNVSADFNNDGKVDYKDLFTLAANYGKKIVIS